MIQERTSSRPPLASDGVGNLAETGLDIRQLMAGFPSGVAIITALDGAGRPRGMTCSSLCSVSLDPPILLVCVRSGSPTHRAVAETGSFAINFLHDGARPGAELFASGAADRFEQVRWTEDDSSAGPHLATLAHSIADCFVINDREVGDHNVVMGQVHRVTQLREQRPLLYGLRRYACWPEQVSDSRLAS
jgi:flavin reductase (DIM6/NTAB) family NADH-FMN oxidoreductase RutF